MQVILIGSGNVANVLGRAIKKAGHEILQVYSQHFLRANLLANELFAKPINDLQYLNLDADIYLIALSDTAIVEVANRLHLPNGILLHTAGSVSKLVLQQSAARCGVLYPLQSLRKEKLDYENIPLLVDGNNDENLSVIENFAKTISSSVAKANDEERLKLHVAAVVVSNFTNYLYALADDYCQKENVPFGMLQPLIAEVANRLQNQHAAEMQTGPAFRKDSATIEKHILLLEKYPDLQAVYQFLSSKILEL